MDSLFLPSNTPSICLKLRVFSTLLLEFKCSTEFMRDIGDHFVAAVHSLLVSVYWSVRVTRGEKETKWSCTYAVCSGSTFMQTSVFAAHAAHIQRQFFCTVLYNSPLPSQPHSAGPSPWRRDYPLPCLSEAGRGSQHGASQPALPGPAPTASQALLFRLAQRGLLYWTRGQFIPAILPQQNDFSQCFVDSQSQGPNEVKWMPVRAKLQERLSSWKHPSSTSWKWKVT